MDKEKIVPVMLVADADKDQREELKNIFRNEFTVVEAANDSEIFTLLEEYNVKIVLISLELPSEVGFDIIGRISLNPRYGDIPILAITDHGDAGGEARAMELGATEFITTPFNKTVVSHRISNVIARYENKRHIIEQAEKDKRIDEMHRFIEKDALTGLYNRETFYKKAALLMQENPDIIYCIIYLDVSCFKAVNDLFRIETGNLILKTAANYFMRAINPIVGLSSRIEADHFVICVPQDAINMDHFIKGLDEEIHTLGISHNILFFAGVYPVTNIALPIDQMCDRASMALNKIKGNYVTRYAFYDASMRERMLKEQMIVRDMEVALQEEQFTIFLQPIYRPETDSIVSAEALVRWFHPVNGMISPGYFIPVFERNGFIVRLDRFVWESVCKFIRSQIDAGKPIIPVSVNVSRLNFYSYDLLIFLLNLLKKYNLEPWMLKLEVTESAYMDNPQQLIAIIQRFNENGFPVLMDDFGSGYSSLNMLKNIQIDILKVDMAFVREIEVSARARTILRIIIELAKELGMSVVTEGVETQTQLDYITSMGSVDIQGYYFSKPLPVEEFKALVDRYNKQ